MSFNTAMESSNQGWKQIGYGPVISVVLIAAFFQTSHFWIAGSPWGAQEGADSSSAFPLVGVESRQSVVVRSTVPQEAAHCQGPTGL